MLPNWRSSQPRRAARRFLKNLPKEKRELLSEDNAERTLLDALRAYEKERTGTLRKLIHGAAF